MDKRRLRVKPLVRQRQRSEKKITILWCCTPTKILIIESVMIRVRRESRGGVRAEAAGGARGARGGRGKVRGPPREPAGRPRSTLHYSLRLLPLPFISLIMINVWKYINSKFVDPIACFFNWRKHSMFCNFCCLKVFILGINNLFCCNINENIISQINIIFTATNPVNVCNYTAQLFPRNLQELNI